MRGRGEPGLAWATVDAFRSVFEALALVNGHAPDRAVECHRAWCVKMGYEVEDGNHNHEAA